MDIPIKNGQHYRNKRGDIYTIKFHNEDVVLLYDGHHYRLENKEYFISLVDEDEGGFEFYDGDINSSDIEIPLRDIDHIGETTAESMEQHGFTTPVDIDRSSDEKILECQGLGEKGLENIREWIKINTGNGTIEI